jgi:hypothetical protein
MDLVNSASSRSLTNPCRRPHAVRLRVRHDAKSELTCEDAARSAASAAACNQWIPIGFLLLPSPESGID